MPKRVYHSYRHGKHLKRRPARGQLLLFVGLGIIAAMVAISIYTSTRPAIRVQHPSEIIMPPSSSPKSLVSAPLMTSKAYGIAAGSSLTSLSDQALNDRMQALQDLGVRWVRYDFDWSLIQPDSSRNYNWSQYDRLVSASTKHHLQVLGILDYTPSWARPAGCSSPQCAPASTSSFANFAGATAHRYHSQGVHAWEVWNEPNSKDFWQPKSNPSVYTSLLKQSYAAIQAQDKAAYVLTGGLSPQATNGSSYTPIDFLQALYKDGAAGNFDGIADHPYTYPLSPSSAADHAWNQMARTSLSLRTIMVNNGDSQKKIWITEFGSPTGGPGAESTQTNPNLDQNPYKVDEALQSKILSDATTLFKSYDWTGPFFVYSYQDAGTDQSTNENFFGLVRADGSHKVAYSTYRTAILAGF
jgi:hypothetical protein